MRLMSTLETGTNPIGQLDVRQQTCGLGDGPVLARPFIRSANWASRLNISALTSRDPPLYALGLELCLSPQLQRMRQVASTGHGLQPSSLCQISTDV